MLRRAQLHGMPEMVTGLAFTCDARALVAAGSDAALRMWDLTSGRVRHTLTGHVAKVRHALGKQVVTGALDFHGSVPQAALRWLLATADSDACKPDLTTPGSTRSSKKAATGLHSGVLLVPAQVCSVDCSPMQPNQAVSGGTDRCIKVPHFMMYHLLSLPLAKWRSCAQLARILICHWSL